jgi:ankyrin repeat protein
VFFRCSEILDQFEKLTYNFTSNPLHLQMICETEGIESLQQPDVISLYEQFIETKIKHGLWTCRQIKEGTYYFPEKFERIYNILTKCAEAEVLEKRGEIVELEEDRKDINLSGVATVIDNESPLEFVHLTFAEFLTAEKFIQILLGKPPHEDMGEDEVKLFVHNLFKEDVSYQTIRFVEGFCDKYKDQQIHTDVLGFIDDESKKEIFERTCYNGMPNLYSLLFSKVFNGVEVTQWMVESHAASNNGMSLYFYACCSSPQLAELLSKWCPMLQINDVDKLCENLAKHTSSRHCIEIALSRVKDWKSRWPRANFFDKYLDSGFSTEFYEFVLENCPDIDIDGLQQKMCVHKECCKEIWPILFRLGADFNCERNGVRLAHIIFRNKNKDGHIELLEFAIRVGKHFQVTENFDSKESLLLRKNIGAKSPQELKLDSNSLAGRGLYLQHIVECACELLDTSECKPAYECDYLTDHDECNLEKISNIAELRPIVTTFKLQLMRLCDNDTDEALRIFQEEQHWIPRDFTYSCGCTLVLDACYSNHLELLEALDQNGFDLNSTNKKGETPLHRAVYWYSEGCTKFLLERFLGQFYIPPDAKREEIVARTPDEQRHVEDTLSQRDAEGRTPLIAATFKGNSKHAKLLIYNLLGPLAILENEEVVTRTEMEQQEVERILSVTDADAYGYTILHRATCNNELLKVMLKNLLGNYFIDGTKKPIQRTLEKQKQIAQLLQPKNKKGKTPLLYGVIFNNEYVYKKHLLSLRNVLGDYFVEKDGTTIRPLEARTDEENQFVRSVMFSEDYEGRSLYGFEQTTDEEYCENLKLLYEANATYLLPKKPQK